MSTIDDFGEAIDERIKALPPDERKKFQLAWEDVMQDWSWFIAHGIGEKYRNPDKFDKEKVARILYIEELAEHLIPIIIARDNCEGKYSFLVLNSGGVDLEGYGDQFRNPQ